MVKNIAAHIFSLEHLVTSKLARILYYSLLVASLVPAIAVFNFVDGTITSIFFAFLTLFIFGLLSRIFVEIIIVIPLCYERLTQIESTLTQNINN